MRRKTVKWVVAILCVVALAGASIAWYARPAAEPEAAQPGEVVAQVNDTEVTAGQLQMRMEQRRMTYAMQEQPITDEELRQEVLDDIIAEILLHQEAVRKGIAVDDDAVEEQLDAMAAQFDDEDQMQEQLAQQGMTEQDLEEQIRIQMKVQGVIDEHVEDHLDEEDLEVSEEEVERLYEEYAEESDDFPDFEEAKPYLREEILHQRKQVVVQELVDELRAEADIDFSP